MVHDIHAIILHQLGFDHTTWMFRSGGGDRRLTDGNAGVVRELPL